MLHQQNLADHPQHLAAVDGAAAGGGEAVRERLDQFEHLVDLALVAHQRDVLREHVGDHQHARRRQVLERDRAAGHHLVVPLRRDLDGRGLVLDLGVAAGQARTDAADDLVLLDRRQPDQDDDAVAEQDGETGVADAKRKRRRRDEVAALEPCGVEALAQQEGAGGHSRHDVRDRQWISHGRSWTFGGGGLSTLGTRLDVRFVVGSMFRRGPHH